MGRFSPVVLAMVSLLGVGAASAQVPVPLGVELHVNQFTTGSQGDSRVARDADGDFVVVWTSSDQDGGSDGVFARRFNSLGAPLATEFQVNTYTVGSQRSPAVSMSDAGAFVVTWESPQDGNLIGVFGRRFSAEGLALAVEFQINTYTTGLQREPAIASEGDGDFIVVWQGPGATDSYGVFGRRFNSAGTPLAAEFRANTTVNGSQSSSALDLAADGRFVVAWQSLGDGSVYGVFAQRFSSSGVLGPEFQVHEYITDSQAAPVVGVDDDGDFVIAWQSEVQDVATPGIFARRFDSAGTPTGVELQVNTYVTSNQISPAIAIDGDGDFVIAWSSFQNGVDNDIFLRRFKSPATPTTGEILVNTYVTGGQIGPALAAGSNGDFVVTWTSTHDPDNGIFAQRFDVPTLVDIDGNGIFDALTDGLLLLRYGFGFTGNTLITGAVGAGCTRCDAPSITAYLQTLL